MPRVNNGGRVGLRVEGIYRQLLEYERRKCDEPDPRRLYTDNPGDPAPVFLRSRHLLRALEAGEAVRLPVWKLGGHTVPDERIRRLKREDRTITGWLVGPDDSVAPIREHGNRELRV
jgi:hypothetical protein